MESFERENENLRAKCNNYETIHELNQKVQSNTEKVKDEIQEKLKNILKRESEKQIK